MDKLIKLGKILKTHGLKGEVKVYSFTSFSLSRYKKGSEVLVALKDNKSMKTLKIVHYRHFNEFDYLTFEGLEDIDLIQDYLGLELYASELPAMKKGDYHYSQLLHLSLMLDGKVVGKVIDINETSADTLLRVAKDNKSYLVPMRAAFIEQINLEQKVIILTKLGGELAE